MKAVMLDVLTGRRTTALVIPAVAVAFHLLSVSRVEAPVTTKSIPNTDSLAHQLAAALYPQIPLEMSALEMPMFDRARNLFLTSRGTTVAETRLFADIIAEHEIRLFSDDDEMKNVRLAAEAVDGIIVRPYELFSFNEIVGSRTERKGYRPGLMFSQGQVVTGIGGGICIVSTALYNAALHSGLKIIERRPHSGRVRYAEPGLDSAIAYGSVDLRFKNDTDSPILIQALIEDKYLKVKLFGRSLPGRKIEIVNESYTKIPFKVFERPDEAVAEGETMVEVEPRTGYEVTTIRLFKQDGKLIRREVVARSTVPPRHKIVLVHKAAESLPDSDTAAEDQKITLPDTAAQPSVPELNQASVDTLEYPTPYEWTTDHPIHSFPR